MTVEACLYALLEFLLKYRLDKSEKGESLVVETLMHLEPLFDHCRNGRYAIQEDSPALFGTRPSLNEFFRSVGDNPNGTDPIVILSASKPKPEKPFWMDREMWAQFTGDRRVREVLWETVTGSTDMSLMDVLDKRYRADLESKLGALVRLNFDTLISSCLYEKIWWSMDGAYRELLGARVMHCLYFYLGFAFAGDRESVERLTPLIQLLPKAVPIGKKPDGTWFIVYA